VPDEDANYFDVTGTPTVTSISATNLAVGSLIRLHFDTVGTLTHSAADLVLPSSNDITVAVGDEFTFIQYAADDYRLVATTAPAAGALVVHIHADGSSGGNTLAIPTISDFTNATHAHVGTSTGGVLLNLGTEQASTSGTAIDFTSIPAGTKRIIIMLVGVSTDGTQELLIQLGDAGGVETSGYLSATNDETTTNTSTAGFILENAGGTAQIRQGVIGLFLEDSANFTWVCSSNINESNSGDAFAGAGSKSLSAELDRVRITTTGTPDDFDAGAINIQFE
jgi:hypothetical protein